MKPEHEYLVGGVPAPTRSAFGERQVFLRVAGVVYAFTGLSDAQRDVVLARFSRLEVPAPEDAHALPGAHFAPASAAAFHKEPEGCWEYDLSLAFSASAVQLAGPSFCATLPRASCRAQALTPLEDKFFLGVFENLFRVVAVYVLAQRDVLVLHSAGVAQAGQGYILFGRSGAGKTTSCRLLSARSVPPGESGHAILSDELNAIDLRPPQGALLQPMPFAGDFGHDTLSSEIVPLRRIYALRQDPVARVVPCAKAEAVARLVAACPFVNADPFESDSVFARASELLKRVPLRKLHFPKDPSFWTAIEEDVDSNAAA